jgi:acetyl-CoA acyltransferase
MGSPAVVGVGITDFGRFPQRSLKDLCAEAVTAAVSDAGIDVGDIGLAAVSNSYAGLLTGQESVRAQTVLAPLGIRGIQAYSVENACASGSTAFQHAVRAVASGEVRYALALGVEKMVVDDKSKTFAALGSSRDLEEDLGSSGSPFMELYAEEVKAHMNAYGSTAEDFAMVAVKNHLNGSLNPHAQFRNRVTVEEVLHSPMVVPPLSRLMCSPIGDGAAAVLVGRAEEHRAAPRVLASVLRSGAFAPTEDVNDTTLAAQEAYDKAGVSPDEVDVAEVHDAATPAEIIACEDLGFAPRGGGVALLRDGVTSLHGRLPVNPSGGLKARGHPVGATGVAMVVEISLQLRGQCGPRQRHDARIGLVQNNGGWVRGAPAAAAVHLLARA